MLDGGIFVRPDAIDDARDSGDGAVACDPNKTPDQESCLVDNQYGVFVAMPDSGGIADASCGSHTAPCATVAEAITAANSGGKSRIFLCQGAFNEAVTLTTHQSLYGGFACPTDGGAWTFADASTHLTSPTNQIALTISGVTGSVDVDDLWITAPDASGTDDAGNGMSSIAVFVNGSTVTFRRCVITAGNGDKGADGVTVSNFNGVTAASGQSPVPEAGTGAEGGLQACLDGVSVSVGGRGGDSPLTDDAGNGLDGAAAPMPPTAPPQDGVGGMGGAISCGSGNAGANGVGAAISAAPALTPGALTSKGWLPSFGSNGVSGNPGQGGGGGGGMNLGGGTGGGAGGCGGAGGGGGRGGGASIALASASATITISNCVLASGAGGRGGNGGDGQIGQGGGSPGAPVTLGTCTGGYGGNGAGGSGGAGGTGGVSACTVYLGAAPAGVLACTLGVAGAPGSSGVGQIGGSNALLGTGNSGADGGMGLTGIAQQQLRSQ